jgi:hypothetical protein
METQPVVDQDKAEPILAAADCLEDQFGIGDSFASELRIEER